jgi:SOS-response transcriptional repressor LexA
MLKVCLLISDIARDVFIIQNTNIYMQSVLSISWPLVGQIAAGWPSPAEEALGDVLTFEEWLVPNKEASNLVTVSTNAMRAVGILKDDIVILERGRAPVPGDVVIARADDVTVIRHYQLEGKRVLLSSTTPENNLIIADETTQLLGVVTAVIRKYK